MKTQFSMSGARTAQTRQNRARDGFTLVEILVVLAIIAILAAILLPVFNAARENSKQVNCASNLQQIGVAVKLYYQDEKKYPISLAVLMPQDAKLNASADPSATPATGTPNVNNQPCDATANTCPNVRGTGYLKSPKLLCPDDDTTATGPRASYGNIATQLGNDAARTATLAKDAGRYVWNYLGYSGSGADAGFAYTETALDGDPNSGTYTLAPEQVAIFKADPNFLVDPTKAYQPDRADTTKPFNPIDLRKIPRLVNRYAPESTIITHCVYHRVPTSSNLAQPQELYPLTAAGANSKDIVLRLSGAADTVDVTTWESDPTKPWVTQRK